ncbi:MAG: Dyp-type peroxidase [Chloroflexota bacterium]|nr:Dyp-type peroxidase [Chloroflexota bacterium]
MNTIQPGILPPVPSTGRFLSFSLLPGADPSNALKALRDHTIGESLVVGIGQSVVLAMGQAVEGLRSFPSLVGPGVDIPATPFALWCWLRGDDRGELIQLTHLISRSIAPTFQLEEVVDAFKYGERPDGLGLDLTGYEDGTENPSDDEAIQAGIVQGSSLAGSSFVAVQRWVHDLDRFEGMSQTDRDNAIGRRVSDNEELEDAPDSAHVKRTAQEDFEPEAFLVRRSMPWSDGQEEGLMFVAYGHSLDAFEAQLQRMAGLDDGITDALFQFSRPVTGSYFWCPPVEADRLNLAALGL